MALARVLLPLTQFAFKMSDYAYMSMLNNPIINPSGDQNNVQLNKVVQSKFSEPLGAKATAAKQRLEQVTHDLVYISESDEPFTFFNIPWKESNFPSVDQFVAVVNDDDVDTASHDEERPTRTSSSMELFFEPLTGGDDPYNQAAEYVQLQDAFVELFGHRVKVYSFGSTEIKVYITGQCEDGLVGVKTTKVET
ncbi:hypothetical protein BGW37DRAFT_53069 [Umbelopsis sp. PMI_123]|nr:hypothetical protein BGW37DRAFT_53069 [Umbelopsis sp. PMI_123]